MRIGPRLSILVATLFFLNRPTRADEGMFSFDRFPSKEVEAKYGFGPTAEWLTELRLASARIAQGCSASFVSPHGLVMTNHHCVHGCVAQLSAAGKDFVKEGFFARTDVEEKRCPALEVDQLVDLADVTKEVEAATSGLSGETFRKAQDAVKARIEKACQKTDAVRCEVVTLYHGGVYDLYTYRRYEDVRLVFAPELAAAFFGGDPDNFEFPRYDLDVSFVRVYDGDRPLATDHHLKWSSKGAKAGELTFVSGNPGRTSREDTVANLEYERRTAIPDRLAWVSELRGLLTGFQLLGAEEKRISTNLLFNVGNSQKAYRGLLDALTEPSFIAESRTREAELRQKLTKDPARTPRVNAAYEAIAGAFARARALRVPYSALEAGEGGGSKLFRIARSLVRGAAERGKPNEDRLPEYTDSALPGLTQELFSKAPIYPELERVLLGFGLAKARERLGADHPAVKRLLRRSSPQQLANELVKETKLADVGVRRALWEGGERAVAASRDPLIELVRNTDPDSLAARKSFEDEVDAPVEKAYQALAAARLESGGEGDYPDATFSPRVSYGKVLGWKEPGTGEVVAPFTNFAGAFARNTGEDPFALPPSWLHEKDRIDLTTPLDFVTDNDVIGGNSGSPVVNKHLEVVGLIFDGNIYSLAGDYLFDPALNRAVAVDSAAISEALSKIYGAQRIVEEIDPGGPKR